jgi:hypothetical protein
MLLSSHTVPKSEGKVASARDLTGQLQVGEVAAGRGTELSPAATDQGRRRRPQLGEVYRRSPVAASPGRRAPSPPPCLPGESHGGGTRGSPPPAPVSAAAAWAVAHDCCVEAVSEGGGRGHGGRRTRLLHRGRSSTGGLGWPAVGRGQPAPGAPDGEDQHRAGVLDADVRGRWPAARELDGWCRQMEWRKQGD